MKDLRASLATAIAWCDEHADPKRPRDSLRSPELMPFLLAADRLGVVRSVVIQRSLNQRIERKADARGRLLVYFPDFNLSDGAAQAESGGFFDVENAPPWDTWVSWFEGPAGTAFLLAWVPPSLVELADRGIRVNPEGCIVWIEDADVSNKTELLDLRPPRR